MKKKEKRIQLGTYETVTTIFWPWLPGQSPLKLVRYPLFAGKRRC